MNIKNDLGIIIKQIETIEILGLQEGRNSFINKQIISTDDIEIIYNSEISEEYIIVTLKQEGLTYLAILEDENNIKLIKESDY